MACLSMEECNIGTAVCSNFVRKTEEKATRSKGLISFWCHKSSSRVAAVRSRLGIRVKIFLKIGYLIAMTHLRNMRIECVGNVKATSEDEPRTGA